MSPSDIPSSPVDASSFAYVVGIDIGSQSCDFCVCKPDKSQVVKPTKFDNAQPGFLLLESKLAQLEVPPERVLIGLSGWHPIFFLINVALLIQSEVLDRFYILFLA